MLTWILSQGVLLGLSNTAGVLAGVFGTAATGYILQRGIYIYNYMIHILPNDIDSRRLYY